ncbi:MAG TPA: carboxymuconolactone decarboxylase family protein [Symbiobacteriaceae bacterium]|nr:carboxymuconolactone decarboxylase family protein [Symbiobacteriaceae bacterium]
MVPRMVADSEAGALSGVYGEIRARLGLGAVPDVFRAMAAVGQDVLVQNWTAFRQTVLEGALPRTLKEMIALVVSREQGCGYSVRFYSHSLFQLGVSPPVVRCLAEQGDCPEFTPDLRRLLAFARESCLDPDGADPDSLEMAGFSEEHAVEVVDTVLIASGIARFAVECGLGAEGD